MANKETGLVVDFSAPSAALPTISEGEEDELINTDLLADNAGGFVVTKALLSYLPEEAQRPQITNRRALQLERQGRFLNRGLAARVPLICNGDECHYADVCPLFQAGLISSVLGRPCPVERLHIDRLTQAYIAALDISVDDVVDLHRLQELIEADILDMRATQDIALNGMFDWNAIGITPDGEVISQKQPAVSFAIKQQIHKRKDKLLQEFVATREARLKSKVPEDSEEVVSKFRKVIDRAEKIRHGEIIDIEDDDAVTKPNPS